MSLISNVLLQQGIANGVGGWGGGDVGQKSNKKSSLVWHRAGGC